MPAKRRKPSQSTDQEPEEADSAVLSAPAAKRKKKSLHCDTADLCQELYDIIRSHRNEEARLSCEPFIRLPNRRSAADYYEAVATPIDLLKIQNKIKSDEYEDVEALSGDIELLVENAKSYYKKGTLEYDSACEIWELFEQSREDLLSEAYGDSASVSEVPKSSTKRRRGDEDDSSSRKDETEADDMDDHSEQASTCADDPDNVFEQLFSSVMTAKDGDRNISEMFQLLPPKSKYPEYYGVIKEPIDLKTIATKIQTNAYSHLDELEKDLLTMVRNAKTFNEPGSYIYKCAQRMKKIIQQKRLELHYNKDAMALKKIITCRRTEIETAARQQPTKTSERIRSKRTTGAQRLSAICAALTYEDEDDESDLTSCHDNMSQMDYEEESGTEGSVVESEDSVLWSLYNVLTSHKNSLGQLLSEPFMRLPSKRNYPDYYREIEKPMSLLNIRKKLKFGQVSGLDEMERLFDLVFDNAKKFNMDTSRIYKDAVKLQKFAKAKKKEFSAAEIKPEPQLDPLPPIPPLHIYLKKEGEDEDNVMATPTTSKSQNRNRKTPATGKLSNLETPQRLVGQADSSETPRRNKSRKPMTPEDILKKRLNNLYFTVYNHQQDGRHLIDIFLELPSKKDYPDYYHVISEPIDMAMIEQKIKTDKYTNDSQLIADFQLMFNNARHYNEEGSMVYKDAETLERVLKRKIRMLTPLGEGGRSLKTPGKKTVERNADPETPEGQKSTKTPANKGKIKTRFTPPIMSKMQQLYDTVKDYQDTHGRTLSAPFMKLPLKSEYPDYYDVIKKPMDMLKIHQRLTSSQYDSLEDMVYDLVLMFDNACKYNEPESLIYKDALTLQRVALEKKAELVSEDGNNGVPDVRSILQEMMTNLFISVFSAQDEEGRCYSDSFAEMPTEKVEEQEGGKPVRKPTFEQVKKNLDKGRYRRMDKFQEDMFEVFEYARKVSRTDSQLYEDAVELQFLFMKQRDELCKNGEILLTPALSYTDKHLQSALEGEKQDKLPREQKEDEEKRKQEAEGKTDTEEGTDSEDSVHVGDQTYKVGDFVYVEPRENSEEPHVVCIEKFWRDSKGDQFLNGIWFCRPKETYHVPTRKFLEKEIFKSDFADSALIKHVIGRCYVMYVKDYFKLKPEGFADKDVYVCESRYSARQKAFKKIKIWQMPKNENVKIVQREEVLSAVRVASVFADKLREDEQSDSEDGQPNVLDRKHEVVPLDGASTDDGCTYYEQFVLPAGSFKLGDFVYVRSDKEKPYIGRIDKMWSNDRGEMYFHGPWFVRPTEVEHSPTRLFYRNEVFKSTIEDTNPMLSILGKCSVLYHKDFCTTRLTEIAELDVFICESKYHEAEKSIRKLAKPMKVRFSTSPNVVDDEMYYFKKPIIPQKEPSPLLMKVSEEPLQGIYEDEDTRDGSLNESFTFTPFPEVEPPQSEKKSKKSRSDSKGPKKPRQPSGYIVFAGEYRKTVQEQNPDSSFGEISKIVGTKWKSLPPEEKTRYEEKAKRMAEEQAAKQAEAEKAFNDSLNMFPPQSPNDRSMSPASSGRPVTPGYQQQQQNQGMYTPGHQMRGMPPPHSMPHRPHPGMSPGMGQGGPHPGMTPPNQQFSQHPQMQQQYPNMAQSPQHGGVPTPGGVPHQGHGYTPGGPHPGVTPPHPMGMHMSVPGMCTQPALSTPTQGTGHTLGMQHGMGMCHGEGMVSGVIHNTTPGLHGSAGVDPGQSQNMGPPPPPPSPMFVSVPPRTQRLLHSEAYLRYIEGLNPESKCISDWERNLNATQDNTPLNNNGRLPVNWLGQGVGHHGDMVNALWALRDYMMKDALTVSRTLEFSQL